MCNEGDSSPTLTNCILWGDEPNEIYDFNSTTTVTYSDVEGGWPGAGGNNIDADPCFVDPCNGDYHLKSAGWRWDSTRNRWDWDDATSRCIDSGNPGSNLAYEPSVVDEWTAQNLRINMGAYGGTAEASIPPYDWALLCDIDNSGIVNLKDFTWLSSLWTEQDDELFADFNRDLNVDSNDLDLLAEDWLYTTTWH